MTQNMFSLPEALEMWWYPLPSSKRPPLFEVPSQDAFTRKPRWMLVTEVTHVKTRRIIYSLWSLLPAHREAEGGRVLGASDRAWLGVTKMPGRWLKTRRKEKKVSVYKQVGQRAIEICATWRTCCRLGFDWCGHLLRAWLPVFGTRGMVCQRNDHWSKKPFNTGNRQSYSVWPRRRTV